MAMTNDYNYYKTETYEYQDFTKILDRSYDQAQNLLKNFLQDSELEQKLTLVFGQNIDLNKARSLIFSLTQEDPLVSFPDHDLTSKTVTSYSLPKIELRSSQEINGAYGAFSGEKNTIFLSEEFLLANKNNTQIIADVILEEWGHSLDYQLNETDTVGDEGAIFSNVVQNKTLNESELQPLQAENDTASITIDGQTILIEQYRTDKLFSLYYVYGNGDYYTGYTYDDGTYGYYNGYAKYTYNETGNTGYYYIYSSYDLGYDSIYTGYTTTTSYYDKDTGYGSAYYINPVAGSSGLGSEYGYAYNYSYSNTENLYGAGYYEADLKTDKLFSFSYTYGNGDYYTGYTYDDGTFGYYNGYAKYTYNETGRTGYYYIYNSSDLGYDASFTGYTAINGYYDGSTGYGSAPNLSPVAGYGGLGSEYGNAYNYSYSNSNNLIGFGYYEANLFG